MKPLPGLEVANLESVPSPSLLVWPGRVQSNIERMIELCGGPERLRPHVKTHKMDAVVRLQLAAGIEKFKASTIAEVEMCLAAGARDVLLAYPVVGPGQDRLVRLALAYPHVRLAFLVDSAEVLSGMIAPCLAAGVELAAFVDFDCGMARTGICSVDDAISLVEAITAANGIRFGGVHAYDGHVRAPGVTDRRESWSGAMESVQALLDALAVAGHSVPAVVGGGSPTFGFHAGERGWQCSPGTALFWDHGYGTAYPDLPFENAAVILTRIVSKPGMNRLCLDLGHKAIASEGPLEKRVHLPGLEEARAIGHSEEHLVVEVEAPGRHAVGEAYLGVPHHICPTVALYQEAFLIRDGAITGESWEVTARNRRLTI